MKKAIENKKTMSTKQNEVVLKTTCTTRKDKTMKIKNTPINVSRETFLIGKALTNTELRNIRRQDIINTFPKAYNINERYLGKAFTQEEYNKQRMYDMLSLKCFYEDSNVIANLHTKECMFSSLKMKTTHTIANKYHEIDSMLTDSIKEEERKNKKSFVYEYPINGMHLFNQLLSSNHFTGIVKGAIKSVAYRKLANKGLSTVSQTLQGLVYVGYDNPLYDEIYQEIALLFTVWLQDDWKEYFTLSGDNTKVLFNSYENTTVDKNTGLITVSEKSYFIHVLRTVENTVANSKISIDVSKTLENKSVSEKKKEEKAQERLEYTLGKYNHNPLDTITECEKVQDLFRYMEKHYKKSDKMKEVLSLKALGYKLDEISDIMGLSLVYVKKLSQLCNTCISDFSEEEKKSRQEKKNKKKA